LSASDAAGRSSGAAQAWRIGALALAGAAVLVSALVVSGLGGFGQRERAVMRFTSSVWGLQVGAPVVLRGVRVGEVTSIGLPGAASGTLALPVVASLDAGQLRTLLGPQASGPALPALVAQGLVARLSTQSLLTGLLYIDLDFDPARTGTRTAGAATPAGSAEIPTAATRLQALQAQREGLDIARIGRDLAEVSAGLRQMLAEPEARQALRRTAEAAQAVQQASVRLQAQAATLAGSVNGTLEDTRRAAAALAPMAGDIGAAARQVSQAAGQVAAAASQAGALATAGTPVLARTQQAADELARAAAALAAMAGEDSSLRRRTDEALVEVARAARALRELAQLLEQQPEAILRGRR
jgi:paraquat-inducible protein B